MADTDSSIPDNPEARVAEGTQDPPDGQGSMFMLDFKDRDAAEHGFKELQAAKTRAEQRAAELEKDVLPRLAKAIEARQSPAMSDAEKKAEREALIERLREGGEEAVVDFTMEVQRQAIALAQEKGSEELKSLKETLGSLKNMLEDVSIRSDPRYQANKGIIDTLVEKHGLSREVAMKILDDVPKGLVIDPGSHAPSEISNSRVMGNPPKRMTEKEKDEIKSMIPNVTYEEIKNLESKLESKRGAR